MKMFEPSVLIRYCLYGSCFIISSEVIYHSYFWLKKKLKELSSSPEVCEVIWTNELSQCCATKPNSHNGKINGASSSSPSRFAKITASFKSFDQCKNYYCAARNISRLIEFIDSAKYSIDLAMYTFTSYELSQAFLRAHNRGVLIRVVSDHEMAYSTGSQIIPLTKSGVPIRCNSSTSFMHHKFCILDSPLRVTEILKKQTMQPNPDEKQVRSILLTGSLNWTNQGLNGNWENILITSNNDFVREYSQEFERIWRVFDVDSQVRKR